MSDRTFTTVGTLDELALEEVVEDCRTDPIHQTASLQAHGTFLQVEPEEREVLSAAANLDAFVDVPAAEALGAAVGSLLGGEAFPDLGRWAREGGPGREHLILRRSGDRILATLFPVGDTLGIELERIPETDGVSEDLMLDVQPVLARLRDLDAREALFDEAVRLVRSITGFDRVMLYEFGEEGHGAVVAEDRAEGSDSYLGQHFPASDIPEPARRLYRKNGIRYIPDVDYEPVPVLGPDGDLDRWDLDLTYSHLRGVPHVHRQYLRNMEVGSSLSVSLLGERELWGLIACHGREAHRVDRARQNLCELIGHTVCQQVARIEAEDKERRRQAVDRWQERFEEADGREGLFGQLRDRSGPLLSLMEATGFYLQLDGDSVWITDGGGEEPPRRLVDHVEERLATERLVSVRSIAGNLEAAWDHSRRISGFLAVRLGSSHHHFCCWLRPEHREAVRWGGDPRHPVRSGPDGRLSPRRSFEEWTQLVSGRCRSWTELDRFTGRELARLLEELVIDVQAHLLRSVNRELEAQNESLRETKRKLEEAGVERQELLNQMEELARTDDLTGLANRRELMRRLPEEIDRSGRYDVPLSVLLLDLDHFKAVNDRFGHQVGDRVLRRVAELLEQGTRSPDLAGRYGGEEFLIVLPESGADRAVEVGERLLEEIRQLRFSHDDQVFRVTCSAGVAELAEDEEGADELVQRADEALYRAKEEGRDRLVRR